MVAEKRIYSTTALQNCYRALRSARWSVRRKDEHMTRCCEVRELYAKCQVNLGCVLFDPLEKTTKKEPPHHCRSS